MSQVTNRRTGWEVECNATDQNGQPVDLREIFTEPQYQNGFAKLVLDAGRDQLEACTNPESQLDALQQEMEQLLHQARTLQGGLELHFDPRRQRGTPASEEDFYKPRLRRMLEALSDQKEGGSYGPRVVEAGNINAFHCHFDVGDACSDEANTVCNLLNAVSPAVLQWAHQEFALPKVGRNQIWTKFARPERLPAPRWFADFQAFRQYFESIERLVKCVEEEGNKHGGAWAIDLAQKQSFRDPGAEGTMWWAVRLRSNYNTVEFRPLPTLANPEHMALVVKRLDEWLDQAHSQINGHQFPDFNTAMASGLIPDFCGVSLPADESEWWKRWHSY